jgi:uncharacterized protein (TIGR02391 family)
MEISDLELNYPRQELSKYLDEYIAQAKHLQKKHSGLLITAEQFKILENEFDIWLDEVTAFLDASINTLFENEYSKSLKSNLSDSIGIAIESLTGKDVSSMLFKHKAFKEKVQKKMNILIKFKGRLKFIPESELALNTIDSRSDEVSKESLLLSEIIHPDLKRRCLKFFVIGEYESAVFEAFKIIEIKVRDIIKVDQEELGVTLLRKAFKPNNGLLTNKELPFSEREAFAHYISGAFGFYKNPSSHRHVDLDKVSAIERIVVASDLLKKIDSNSNKT